jgi:hypothetical protein
MLLCDVAFCSKSLLLAFILLAADYEKLTTARVTWKSQVDPTMYVFSWLVSEVPYGIHNLIPKLYNAIELF